MGGGQDVGGESVILVEPGNPSNRALAYRMELSDVGPGRRRCIFDESSAKFTTERIY